jgi:hypothetical protein
MHNMEGMSKPYQREQRLQREPINHGESVQDYDRYSEQLEESLDIPYRIACGSFNLDDYDKSSKYI